jgi:hypothetical protein
MTSGKDLRVERMLGARLSAERSIGGMHREMLREAALLRLQVLHVVHQVNIQEITNQEAEEIFRKIDLQANGWASS